MQNRITDELVAASRLHDQHTSGTEVDPANLSEALRDRFDRSRQAAEQFVVSHPIICLAAAASLGITLGWWTKRK